MNIVLKNISKIFESKNGSQKVLEDITAEAYDSDFISVLGPNGCGKTTLLKIIAGILTPSGGEINFRGNYDGNQPASFIYQEEGLFPWLNVIDNVCFHLESKGMSKAQRYEEADEFIEKMGLRDFKEFYPYQLSSGMKKKVCLIRGMLLYSEVLLVDEPDTHLDTYAKILIQEDIFKIWQDFKKTIIYVTHDVEAALKLSKHIWLMSNTPSVIVEKIDLTDNRKPERGAEANHSDFIALKDHVLKIIFRESKKKSLQIRS